MVRGAKREFVSRCYNLLLRGTLVARFSDAQCGFKAIRADVAAGLLPLVEDDGWFFDTELLVLAERGGLRIHEVPVDWVDDPDSRVDIVATAVADLRGHRPAGPRAGDRAAAGGPAARPARPRAAGPGHRGRAGRADPPAGAVRRHRGRQHGGVPAALPAAAHRPVRAAGQPARAAADRGRATPPPTGGSPSASPAAGGAARHQLQGLAVFALGLALTSGSLAALHAVAGAAPVAVEVGVLVAANLAATVLRFLLLRSWVFGSQDRRVRAPSRARPRTERGA